MAGFSCACGAGGEVAFAEFALEELEDQRVAEIGEGGVVAGAFIAHEGVLAVEFVPGVMQIRVSHGVVNNPPAFAGDVGVLAAEDHQHLAFDFGDAVEGIVFHAFAEGSLVDVGGVEAGGGEDAWIHGGAEGEVAADADADCADFFCAIGAGFQVREDSAGVGVVAGEFLGDFVGVAFVSAGLRRRG
jgi:hypothetical protein